MALTHFCQDIQLGGVSSNWSSETPETLHKLLPKSLYGQTNHKDYHIPMLEMLTVHETKRVRHQYNQWRSSPNSQTHPCHCQIIVPRIMASRLLRGHTNKVYLSQVSPVPKQDLSQQF